MCQNPVGTQFTTVNAKLGGTTTPPSNLAFTLPLVHDLIRKIKDIPMSLFGIIITL